MRKIFVAAWIAAASVAAAVPAAADSPISLPPLAPGEVLLEVSGLGVTRTPASHALITVAVLVQGETEAAARRAAQEAIGRVSAAARGAGAGAADIQSAPLELREQAHYDMIENGMGMNLAMDAESGDVPRVWVASGTAVVRLRNAAGAPDLASRLSAAEGVSVSGTTYELEDDSAARRSSRADAVRRARADAESYAASVGMRIARVLRVTERTGLESVTLMFTEHSAARRFAEGPLGQSEPGFVHTYAVVGIDYALAPAR